MFVGRANELTSLHGLLEEVEREIGDARPGRCLLVRGRRRIGKSTLLEEFLQQLGPATPSVFFTAAGADEQAELAELTEAVRRSTLPDHEVFADAEPGNWSAAFRQLAGILPDDRPSVVVLDEVPYLMNRVDAFEGILQRAWDRDLSRAPVLLVLVGSDLSMMEALSSYGRPFHQRGREMNVGPLTPADVADMLELDPADAFDAALVTGGLPMLCSRWDPGESFWSFLGRQLSDPLAPLLVSAERTLAAEFPDHALARRVLAAIGGGERTFGNIARAAGGIAATTLTRATETLIAKGIVAGELPVSLAPSRERRYRVTDPYLRFWFSFVQPHLPEIERLRGDLALDAVRAGWTSWRGRTIEPLVRESLARLLPAHGIDAVPIVGGYWTRSNDVEIDLVGSDRAPVARRLAFLGSIKWLERRGFDDRDVATLQRQRVRVTDDPVPLVAVSRTPATATGLAATFGPDDLLGAWRSAQPPAGAASA